MILAWLLVGSEPSLGTDPLSLLLSYGPMGVVAAVFIYLVISGHLVPGKEHLRVVEENAELRRQVPDVVAALTQTKDALLEATKVQRDVLVMLEVRKQLSRDE